METFKTQNQNCMLINGKEYFLIRAYELSWGKYIFIQVSGNTPLHKEDMPAKDWEILTTRSGKTRVYTAYKKKLFAYNFNSINEKKCFLGATTTGSYFLLFRYLNNVFNLGIFDADLFRTAQKYSSENTNSYLVKQLNDEGNSGQRMVYLDSCSEITAKEAKDILINQEDEENND